MPKYDIHKHREFILQLEGNEKNRPIGPDKVKLHFFSTKQHTVVIYRSSKLGSPPYSTVFNIRGTGFTAPAHYYSYIICTHLAELSGCQIIDLIPSRLAPEHTCPTAFNEAYDAYKMIVKYHKILEIDLNKLAICGYSSGAYLTALIANKANKNNLPLSLQILISPIVDLSRSLSKFKDNEDKDDFPDDLAQWFIDCYLKNTKGFYNPKDPEISPFFSKELKGVSPTHFLVGGHDRFLSDTKAYTTKLKESGVATYTTLFKKQGHMFFWKDIRALEKTATRLKYTFYLFKIERPLTLRPSNEHHIPHESLAKIPPPERLWCNLEYFLAPTIIPKITQATGNVTPFCR